MEKKRKEARMSLSDFRKYLREKGFKATYTEYNGRNVTVPQAVHVWGDNLAEAVKVAQEYGYRVEKNGKRYMIY